MQQTRLKFLDWMIPVALGAIAFLLVYGPQILIPTNISWLQTGDRAQHFLGWQFFRYGPWQFPIGLNPDFGLELSSAIIFSDSNPLFAILFKAFGPLLPEPFQYFGLWILVCLILQALLAWKIAAIYIKSTWPILFITVIAIFSPPFLLRLLYHMSLGAHFIVLGALYLALRDDDEHRVWPWALLLSIAVGLHAYLLVLAGALWGGHLIDLLRSRRISLRLSLVQIIIVLACVLLTMFMVGYFSTRSVAAPGYGSHRLNLLSYFNPLEWSYIFQGQRFDLVKDNFEGFSYAGLGTLILIPFALFAGYRLYRALGEWLYDHLFLFIVCVLLTLFAISHEVGIGNLSLRIDLPEQFLKMANTFRASGRMFWPSFYGLLFLIALTVGKAYRPPIACTLLFVGALTQLLDTSAGWKLFGRERIHEISSSWDTPLKNPIWEDFMHHYPKVRTSNPADLNEWKDVAYLAGTYHRATDSVMLARVDEKKLAASKIALRNQLLTGQYASDSLYVLDELSLMIALPKINPSTDLLALIDGRLIVAPGWVTCATCTQFSASLTAQRSKAHHNGEARLQFGKRVYGFSSSDDNARFLVTGWSIPESWGVWSNSQRARVTIPASSKVSFLTLTVHPYLNLRRPKQRVFLTLNTDSTSSHDLSEPLPSTIRIPITETVRKQMLKSGSVDLDFYLPDAAAPSILGTGLDDRTLGIGLHSIEVYE